MASAPGRVSCLLAVSRFHGGVGARLALRAAAPAFAAAFGAATLLGVDFLASFARALYGPAAGPGTWLVPALTALALAGAAARRVCRGLPAGWLRHLPVSGSAHRRGAVLAVTLAQTPLLIALAVLAYTAAGLRFGPALATFLGLPLLALAAGVAAVPARRRLASAPLAGVAALAAASGRPPGVLLAAALIPLADAVAGPIGGRPAAPRWRGRTASGRALRQSPRDRYRRAGLPGGGAAPEETSAAAPELERALPPALQAGEDSAALAPAGGGLAAAGSTGAPGTAAGSSTRGLAGLRFTFRTAWRAVGRRLAGSFFLGLLPLAGGAMFLANNALPPRDAALAARLAAGAAVALLLGSLGETLSALRPAWPWARSLPWSGARRAAHDALWLGLHAAPLLVLAALRAPLPALATALPLPWLALRAAGAVRRAPERRTGASGEILLEAFAVAAAVALLPWVGALLLAAAPWALRAAAGRDRRQKVSRWLALHHLAAGDPQSWSAE